ncbi:hypothetical protein AOLI_G00308390 [Acnodon oligacanthus]
MHKTLNICYSQPSEATRLNKGAPLREQNMTVNFKKCVAELGGTGRNTTPRKAAAVKSAGVRRELLEKGTLAPPGATLHVWREGTR